MSMTAPTDVEDFLASLPKNALIANLFTFSLLSGPVYRFTDWRRPVTPGVFGVSVGQTFLSGPPRFQRGTLMVERGTAVSTLKITMQEANAAFITLLVQKFFNRALFTMDRCFASAPGQPWTSAYNRFTGRVNAVDEITNTSTSITVKSMMDDLDNDYPRSVLQADCDATLFDVRCGLSAAAYRVSGTVAAGSTKNTLLSGLTQADVFFTQGVITFTSGLMNGLNYMVKNYAGGIVTPAMPFLVAPAAGTTFTITPGCDKTLATCISKYGYVPSTEHAPFFRGAPYVPDPTVTY
jgi:hypothetical protein